MRVGFLVLVGLAAAGTAFADLPPPFATPSTANVSQRAARTDTERCRQASQSICSRAGSTRRASFASRRTATSSWRKPARGACASFV
jgi:hypothetical protein